MIVNTIDSLVQEQLPPISPEEAERLSLSEDQKALQPDVNIGMLTTSTLLAVSHPVHITTILTLLNTFLTHTHNRSHYVYRYDWSCSPWKD